MAKILIYGNVTKDVYLEMLDDNAFETDENNTSWLNLEFNSAKHNFGGRFSVLGGAEVTKEVLTNYGLEAVIADEKVKNDYRYILIKENGIAYFTNKQKSRTEYVEPDENVGAIIVDRSAEITLDFAKKLAEYKAKHPNVPVVLHLPKIMNDGARMLIGYANLIFCENEHDPAIKDAPRRKIVFLSDKYIKTGSSKIALNLTRNDKITHLTLFSVMVGSIVGGILTRRKVGEILRLTKANVENIKLNKTLEMSELMNIVETEESEKMNLKIMAKFLVGNGKGILAADESGGSIHKKFESMNIPDDEEHRRNYRKIFLTTENLEKYVNGVILFDETARQNTDDGRNFVKYLTSRGVVPGIKVDIGLKNFTNSEEKYTSGLDGLRERLHEYYEMGLRFAKWRAAFEVSETTPSDYAISENCKILAEYARECQAENIVPIVEPELVFDGDYGLNKSKEITSKILKNLFACLNEVGVELNATILKVNMVIAGKKFPVQSTPEEVGEATAEVLRECVPKELAGVVFLSGGQTVEQATENLQAVTNNGPFPWPVTFSFARALQEPALLAWKGDENNAPKAKKAFSERLVKNCEALKKSV